MTKKPTTVKRKNIQDGNESTEGGYKEKSHQNQGESGQATGPESEVPTLESLTLEQLNERISDIIFSDKKTDYLEFKKELERLLRIYIQKFSEKSPLDKHLVTFLCTKKNLSAYHLDCIHKHLKKSINDQAQENKDILLIINNPGGAIEPAFQISKICNKYAEKKKFIVAIPRQAKSAATLLSIGANEIHMGDLSELGPIDPQLPNGFPALGVREALSVLAEIVTKYPKAVPLFSKFLERNMNLEILGWLTRIPQSASQYAQKLLKINYGKNEKKIQEIAKALVEDYKHHGFVIDADEAEAIFGKDISKDLIKKNTKEIKAVESLYENLSSLEFFVNMKWRKPDSNFRIEIDLVGESSNCTINEVRIG